MKGIKEMNPSIQKAITVQFGMIGKTHDIEGIDFKDTESPFFRAYCWTEEEQQRYIDWFADELMRDSKFRKEILESNRKPTIKTATAAAQEWNLMYGFIVSAV